MNIEQAIYTHTKVRRDTRSTGFGYYSTTPGMERLLHDSSRLAAVSSGYISPRNSDCWWEKDEQELSKRDEIEAKRIREHHPVCFGYTTADAGGKELAALTFGRNLGRDLSPLTRDGNILVNTLVLPADELEGYPYEYCGSRELFVDFERSFFLNAPDEPAPFLTPPASITPGDAAPTAEDIESFLEEEDRLPALCSMLGALMQINDGGDLKRMIVCDKKENIIFWIAALSLVFPAETAKRFTFRTYSFFGCNSDDFSAVYDDVMFCGAYTPSVNGDPKSSRATNYSFAYERDNPASAVFDLEHGYVHDSGDSCAYFSTFIESAFSTDMRILKSYHDFIISKTTCRTLGSDYAKGYSCYTIFQLRNEHSLKYLPDAFDFALKYMDADALRQLLGIAFACTIDAGREGASFADILSVSQQGIENGKVDEEYVKTHYISFLISLITTKGTACDDYYRLKEQIACLFERSSESIGQALVTAFTVEGILQMTPAEDSGWKFTELADCIYRSLCDSSRFYGTDEELIEAFDDLALKQLFFVSGDSRRKVIDGFAEMLEAPADKAAFLEDMYLKSMHRPDICPEIIRSTAALCINDTSAEMIHHAAAFAGRVGERERLCACILQDPSLPDEAAERAEVFERIVCRSDGILDDCFDMFITDLEEHIDGGEPSCEGIYLVFSFARRCGKTDCVDMALLCADYYSIAAKEYGAYGLTGRPALHLLEMASELEYPQEELRGHLGNMVTLLFVSRYADEPDVRRMCLAPSSIMKINFDILEKPGRSECIRVLGGAFALRSMTLGTALNVNYDMFVDTKDASSEEILSDVFLEWITVLAERGSKNAPVLIGETLAMSVKECKLDARAVGRLLSEFRVKLADVRRSTQSPEVMQYISKNCDDPQERKADLNKLMNDIEGSAAGRKPSFHFGKKH